MKVIQEANLTVIKSELSRMLGDGIRSPEVRNKAIEIMDPNDRIASIFSWAKSNFEYVPDPIGRELFVSPRKMLERLETTGKMAGDCDDAALLISSLLGAIGYDVKIDLVGFNGNELSHAIGVVNTESGWLDLDLTNVEHPLGWLEKYQRRESINAG